MRETGEAFGDRAHILYLKNSEDEVRKMCRAMEITYEEGRKEGRMEGYVRGIRSLMRKQGLSDAEAMDVLEIPARDRPACAAYLERRTET